MRITLLPLLALVMTAACSHPQTEDVSNTIIGLERAALDRWGKGDPQGYSDLYAQDITYFDPTVEKRVDGVAEMKALYQPIAGKISVARFDMIEPTVQQLGDIAILTFNLISYGPQDVVLARWNSTEVYNRTASGWKIVHNHWSLTQPELKNPPKE